MFKFVILLSAVACALGAAIPEGMLPQLDGRIVGGVATNIKDFPWQISLHRFGSHSCGGSIYNSKTIVTAAHCIQSITAPNLKVRAGSTYWNAFGQYVSVREFKSHENYDPNTLVNDIGILILSNSLKMGDNVKAIELASIAPEDGIKALVSGWGTVYYGANVLPLRLRYTDVAIVSRLNCSSSYSYGSAIKDSMICAYTIKKDACQGDSGGPLVVHSLLVGVVSWGYGCAEPNYPGVYADVAALKSWVDKNANALQKR